MARMSRLFSLTLSTLNACCTTTTESESFFMAFGHAMFKARAIPSATTIGQSVPEHIVPKLQTLPQTTADNAASLSATLHLPNNRVANWDKNSGPGTNASSAST
jgi:hypothetical protein